MGFTLGLAFVRFWFGWVWVGLGRRGMVRIGFWVGFVNFAFDTLCFRRLVCFGKLCFCFHELCLGKLGCFGKRVCFDTLRFDELCLGKLCFGKLWFDALLFLFFVLFWFGSAGFGLVCAG